MAGRSERLLQGSWMLALLWLVGAGARIAWQGRDDRADVDRYALQIESLRGLDAKLVAETLKARSGLVPHYDALVQTERALDELQRALHGMPDFLDAAQRARLTQQLAAFEQTSQATLALVERFKTENAVLRNSLLFLRTAAGPLDTYAASTPAQHAFREEANALVRDVLLLRLAQDARVLERVTHSLDQLSAQVPDIPGSRRSEFALILAHARAVRDRAPTVDRLVRQIIDQPTLAGARDLSVSYAAFQRAHAARASQSTASLLSIALLVGALVACVVIVRLRRAADAQRRAGEQLRQTLAALQVEQEKQRELSELKTRFVSMTSHEFRTPLSTILSSSELLHAYDGRFSREKKAQHFGRIQVAVVNMTRMLDSILLIGRSDAGKLEFRPSPLDLNRFCSESAEAASKSLSQTHALSVDAALDEGLVVADEALLKHVVDNLLNNAIKYSPRGGRIDFGVKRDGEDVVFDVRDQGIGIPVRDQPRLFETFHRGANVGTVAGSGLGLSIVKRAVDLHGGSVQVESELGVGTRFVVRMRCPRSAA